MSLLLEALKKAEKAKDEAQKRARGDAAASASRAELALEPAAAGKAEKPVLTRPELPDIRQPLEIVSDDLAPKPARGQAAAALASEPEEPAGAAARAAAKKVFEAKFKEPNPRLPFHIALGVLGALSVATVAYFWYQLRPPPPLVNANPVPTTAEAVAAPAATPAPQPAALAVLQPQLPGLPALPPKRPPQVADRDPPPAAAPAAPSRRAPPKRAQSAPEAEPRAALTFVRPEARIHPRVDAGYAAYMAGDLAQARTDYQQALQEDPSNRDALLGLAAVESRSGRHEAAEGLYVRLLQFDPRDAHAQAGLIGLRGARIDPVLAESRVKTLLAYDPDAAVLHFTLGNQLAQQGRWPEAQQQYFKAFAAEPENADFAYNLAVSLDQLRQPKQALEYYQRALGLAAKASASFDARAARERIAQLAH